MNVFPDVPVTTLRNVHLLSICTGTCYQEILMLLKTGFAHAEKFGKYLLSSEIELSGVDESAFERTWVIFRTTKTMNFTDCSNLALMEVLRIERIATFDKEFSGKAEVIG